MKLRTKLLLCFLAACAAMAGISVALNNRLLTRETERAKREEYRLFARQTLGGLKLVSDDVENTLLSLLASTELARTAADTEQPEATRVRNLRSKLRYLCYDSAYFTAALFVDADGEAFFGASALTEPMDAMLRLYEQGRQRLSESYTVWFSDDAGNIYLKKDLYAITPLYRSGVLVVRLDASLFRSLLSLDIAGELEGWFAVVYGADALLLGGEGASQEGVAALLQGPLQGGAPFVGTALLDGDDIALACESDVAGWRVLRAVPVWQMLSGPRRVLRGSALAALFTVLLITPVLILMTRSLTRGVRRLTDAMIHAAGGDFDLSLETRDTDEIGELTRRFHWLQGQLKALTRDLVARATAQQEAEYEMLEVKYRSLQSQVSPHFLCNILTTICAMAETGCSPEIVELSVMAGRYLRDNLRSADSKTVPLSREIRYVEEYIDIYRLVYGDHVRFDIDADDALLARQVPYMLLQPLVENALMHGGFSEDGRACALRLQAREAADGALLLSLSDNGDGIPPALMEALNLAAQSSDLDRKLQGVGLRIVLQRLRLLYGHAQRLEVESGAGGTTVRVRIPADA